MCTAGKVRRRRKSSTPRATLGVFAAYRSARLYNSLTVDLFMNGSSQWPSPAADGLVWLRGHAFLSLLSSCIYYRAGLVRSMISSRLYQCGLQPSKHPIVSLCNILLRLRAESSKMPLQ